jgi:predicted ArsR family transcriptional regulator
LSQPLAFAPVPLDRLAAAGDPELRRALLYARGRREPFTAAEAAAVLGVHRNVARSRLDRLVEAGFLSVAFERRGGRRGPGAGRPGKVYRVAPELEGVEFPDRRYAELIALLVERVPVRARDRTLREAGREFGGSLAAAAGLKASTRVRAGLERVCDALGALGFQASLHALQRDQAILATPTCPLRPLVVKLPDAGKIDQGMWAAVVECAVDGIVAADIECDSRRCLDPNAPCHVAVSLQRQESASGATAKR